MWLDILLTVTAKGVWNSLVHLWDKMMAYFRTTLYQQEASEQYTWSSCSNW